MGRMDTEKETAPAGDIRSEILRASFALIKQYGLIHTSVEKITRAVGIGKGSFYAYFPSKEEMVYALLKKLGEDSYADFLRRLAGREKMTEEEGKEYFYFLASGPYSILPYITAKEMAHLSQVLGPERYEEISVGNHVENLGLFLSRVENVREDVDLPLIVSLRKISGLAFRHWGELANLPPKEEVFDIFYSHLFSLIFND